MEAAEVARRLSGEGRILEVGRGVNRMFRIWGDDGTHLVKVYAGPAAQRREHQALLNLSGLPGLPEVVDEGVDEDRPWVMFRDPGKWNLASLPENPGLARKAGEILAALHSFPVDHLSNVSHGIDQSWVAGDFPSTFRRLERYRGRLHIPANLIAAAAAINPPFASEPTIAHTNPSPELFFVDDEGHVTLLHWEWSTLAPPEWDYSRAVWLLRLRAGSAAAAAMGEGYGKPLDHVQLDRWTVYHSGMMLIQEAEMVDQQVAGVDYLIEELKRAVSGAESLSA